MSPYDKKMGLLMKWKTKNKSIAIPNTTISRRSGLASVIKRKKIENHKEAMRKLNRLSGEEQKIRLKLTLQVSKEERKKTEKIRKKRDKDKLKRLKDFESWFK